MFIVKLFTVAFLLVSSALALIVPENSNLVRMPTYGGSRSSSILSPSDFGGFDRFRPRPPSPWCPPGRCYPNPCPFGRCYPPYVGGGGGFGRDLGSFLSKRGSVGKAAILGTHDEPKSVDGEGGGEGGVGAPKLSSTA